MSFLTISRSFRRTKDGTSLEMSEDPLPKSLKPTEVLIKIHAVSLNYRDVAMIKGLYPVKVIDQGVPCSDAAATVIAVGSSVSTYVVGDYVCPAAHIYWLHPQQKLASGGATGGDVDGLLREYAIFDQEALTRLPAHLSYEAASTICCAGTTAWSCLDLNNDRRPKVETMLAEGTGGVSLWAMILCLAAGITPVITSSSDEKLTKIKALSTEDTSVMGINYCKHPDWAKEARKLTNGKGVDIVINNVGVTTIERSLNALCDFGGAVMLVGFLGGFGDGKDHPDTVLPILRKGAKIQYVLFVLCLSLHVRRFEKLNSTGC